MEFLFGHLIFTVTYPHCIQNSASQVILYLHEHLLKYFKININIKQKIEYFFGVRVIEEAVTPIKIKR